MSQVNFTVSLQSGTRARLKSVAQRSGVSQSWVIEETLQLSLSALERNFRSPREVLRATFSADQEQRDPPESSSASQGRMEAQGADGEESEDAQEKRHPGP